MNRKLIKNLTMGALIAALYTALTLIVAPLSFGPVQLRLSEAMTVLPAVCPPAIAGLTLGCFLSNIIGFFMGANPIGVIDAFVGSAATLLAAVVTAYIGKKFTGRALYFLAPLPPVLFNGLFIGAELAFILTGTVTVWSFALSCIYVALGEAVACYIGGNILLKAGCKYFSRYFKE